MSDERTPPGASHELSEREKRNPDGWIRAIPTQHRGIQFRSRLEARWAMVFDALGWRWEYEPIDLKGYIPDFVMVGWDKKFLIEVKPEMSFNDLKAHREKIEQSGWDGEAMLVGGTCNLSGKMSYSGNVIGLVSQRFGGHGSGDGAWDWHEGVVAEESWQNHTKTGEFEEDPEKCRTHCLFAPIGAWNCYRCGVYCKFVDLDLSGIWNRAGNAVQWQARR